MADAQPFSFEDVFAKSAPPPRSRIAPPRGKYDFAIAYADPPSVPLDDLLESLKGAFDDEGQDLAVYPHAQGYPPLREFIASKLTRDRGLRVTADDIFIGNGSGQPLGLLTEALVDPGDVVLTEEWSYSGTLSILRRFRADIRGVPCDDEGFLPDALEHALQKAIAEGRRPKFIYTIPTFQNPMGWVMTLERRQALVRLSQQYGVPILEDDCYADLRFEGEPVPSLHSLDDTGRVMYVASFSKIIAPGVRTGYMTAPPEVLDRVQVIKQGGGANQLASLAVHRYATTKLDEHIEDLKNILRTKRDAMLAALGENFGSAATWSHPTGAMYIWGHMPEGTDLSSVQEKALADADVGFHTGVPYAPDGVSGKNHFRLCFGYNSPEEIQEGIGRLAGVFEKEGLLKG
ncbi:MAG: PLP-dependent aminotransferase family protein [Chloroflexi bacterium]|nr:PLP-dependent aminotransferase family protein [Chloroflexota bacterium]